VSTRFPSAIYIEQVVLSRVEEEEEEEEEEE
jgi:hypothetical protein